MNHAKRVSGIPKTPDLSKNAKVVLARLNDLLMGFRLKVEPARSKRIAHAEYDGVQHWADSRQRSWDIERIALLEAEGWIVVRVTAEMLKRPHVIADRVASALVAHGCPRTW